LIAQGQGGLAWLAVHRHAGDEIGGDMLMGLRSRPVAWLLVAGGTLAAMAATMVLAIPGGAATPEKEYTASFMQPCVIGPGSINQKATLEVATRSKGPESVVEGQEFEPHESSSVITSPADLGNALFALGVRHVTGKVSVFELLGHGLSPQVLNIAKPSAFPEGLPYESAVEQNKATSFAIPHAASYSFGPYKVTGHSGENVQLEVNSEAGFKEVGAGEYEGTGKGIVASLEGVNEIGGHVIGPLPVVCTAPANVVLATIPIGPGATSTTSACSPAEAPHNLKLEPAEGPTNGGSTVRITGEHLGRATAVTFGSAQASFTVNSATEISAIVPPGTGKVTVEVTAPCSSPVFSGAPSFTYRSIERVEYKSWVLSGALTDKLLGQAITLPAGSTFNGVAELNIKDGAGSVDGKLAMPAFTAPLQLFAVLPAELGMTFTQEGPIAGTLAKSKTVAGDETLSLPVKLGMSITALDVLGLKIPARCATAEPLALVLVDNLTREELLSKGWSFATSTTIPRIKCEGGLLGPYVGKFLTSRMSGPENAFAITVTAPVV
jgi:hypothetical protein